MTMVLASSLGKIVHPLFVAFAWLLAEFYSVIPNYAVAIALLTVTVMVIVFPITRRGTRSMMKMQLLAPQLKVIQNRYKAKPSMSVVEKQESRAKLNEEMMALYKENGVSPTGGCVPMFLQLPIFWILYSTIRGLTHEVKVGKGIHATSHVVPLYISHTTALYKSIVLHHGNLPAFGINLADSVRSAGLSDPARIPYIVMILIAIALQYFQMKQLSGRNPAAAAANPQMQQMQKVMPLIFAFIYISIPAGVNVYFIVSALFRIGQQEFMYRHDPQLRASLEQLKERTKNDPKVIAARAVANQSGQGFLGRMKAALPAGDAAAAPPAKRPAKRPPATASSTARSSQAAGKRPAVKTAAGRPRPTQNGAAAASTKAAAAPPKAQPRAQGKRARRPR